MYYDNNLKPLWIFNYYKEYKTRNIFLLCSINIISRYLIEKQGPAFNSKRVDMITRIQKSIPSKSILEYSNSFRNICEIEENFKESFVEIQSQFDRNCLVERERDPDSIRFGLGVPESEEAKGSFVEEGNSI